MLLPVLSPASPLEAAVASLLPLFSAYAFKRCRAWASSRIGSFWGPAFSLATFLS